MARTAGEIPASGLASAGGIAGYDVSSGADSDQIVLYDASGAQLGVVDVSLDETGQTVAAIVMSSGERAEVRLWDELPGDEEVLSLRAELRAEARVLVLRLMLVRDPDDTVALDRMGLNRASLEAVLADGATTPDGGGIRPAADGTQTAVLALIDNGLVLTTEVLRTSWLESLGLQALVRSRALNTLFMVLLDESLYARTVANDLVEDSRTGSLALASQGLDGCEVLIDQTNSLSTNLCAGFIGAIVVTEGAALFAIVLDGLAFSCFTSFVAALAKWKSNTFCGRATADWTLERCRDEWFPRAQAEGRCPLGRAPRVRSDATGCECVCDDDRCESQCQFLVPGARATCVDALTCACEGDADVFCSNARGNPDSAEYCLGEGRYVVTAEYYLCPVASCGTDGRTQRACTRASGATYSEECDPSDATFPCLANSQAPGCSDSCQCVPCQCDWLAQTGCESLALQPQGAHCDVQCQCVSGCRPGHTEDCGPLRDCVNGECVPVPQRGPGDEEPDAGGDPDTTPDCEATVQLPNSAPECLIGSCTVRDPETRAPIQCTMFLGEIPPGVTVETYAAGCPAPWEWSTEDICDRMHAPYGECEFLREGGRTIEEHFATRDQSDPQYEADCRFLEEQCESRDGDWRRGVCP